MSPMSQQRVSIIIPCYNCEATVREAVASCFRQGIEGFEIVMIDDCSTDRTWEILEELSQMHPEVRVSQHDRNRGGGAARTSAVALAKSATIFCLDSDDLLADGTLATMLNFMKEKGCDGVGVHHSVKFNGTDVSNVEVTHTFARAGERILLNDLLERDGLCSLYSTFLFSKEAFVRAGGYPTEHGFDTQGFAWRFLTSGAKAYTCPDTTYLHRVNFHESYYLREAAAGRVNYNWFEIFDEHFHLFSAPLQEVLLYFNYRDITSNIFEVVRKQPDGLVARNALDWFVELTGKEPSMLTAAEEYWLGTRYAHEGSYEKAREFFLLANRHKPSMIVHEKLRAIELHEQKHDEASIRAIISSERAYIRRNSLAGVWIRAKKKFLRPCLSQALVRTILRNLYLLYQDMRSRIGARHSASLVLSLAWLACQKLFLYKFPRSCSDSQQEAVDIVILTLPKDRVLLTTYIDCLKRSLCHPIGDIYLVAPKDPSLEEFCTERSIAFIDERTVLGYGKERIDYSVNGQNRAGWLFQQLLKLSGDSFVKNEQYIIVDSDTLLVQPHSFKAKSRYVFFENTEWQEAYFRAFERLFGYEAPTRRSFTSHMMIFNVQRLKQMKAEIERKHGVRWDSAYIESADKTKSSAISDYETYGNWLLYNHPEEVSTVPFYNISFSRKRLSDLDALIRQYSGRYASFSFHSYNA